MVLEELIEPLIGLPRAIKRGVAIGADAGLCVLTVWLAFWLRTGEWVPLSGYGWPAALASVLLAMPIFMAFGLYKAVFRYVSWDGLASITQALFLYGLIYAAVFTAFAVPGVPRTVGIIQPILLFLALVGTRAMVRYLLGGRFRRILFNGKTRNVLIYGAGGAGRQLAAALADTLETRVVGFVDDARDLQGSVIGGIPVFSRGRMPQLVAALDVAEIFLAVPSARQSRRNEIIEMIREIGVGVRTLPGLLDIAQGKVTVSHLRPLDIEDLLGRDPVEPDLTLLETVIREKVVLVTGAGGSIGSELCRQILAREPAKLLLLDVNEFGVYGIHRELLRAQEQSKTPVELVPLLGSVCDEARIRRIFAAWRPDVVYHAAAYKHVPLVEHNAVEGVRNNVFGTLVCAALAQEFEVSDFVLVSTDKAVRPTNIMGASKRLAEMILQAFAANRSQTCFSMVRFGNVLGSSGSVVPLFRQQIGSGGPVTVTHPEVIRYFMTIPEAAQLVLQAGAMASGGDVFVLDMGRPVRIVDLAHRMIELSGLKPVTDENPDGDIEVTFTGLRPGEKLYEELLIADNPTATGHPRIMMAEESFVPLHELEVYLARLRLTIDSHDVDAVRGILIELIPEFHPATGIVDWVRREERKALDADFRRALPLSA